MKTHDATSILIATTTAKVIETKPTQTDWCYCYYATLIYLQLAYYYCC